MKGWAIFTARVLSLLVVIVFVSLVGHDMLMPWSLQTTTNTCGGATPQEQVSSAQISLTSPQARAGAPFGFSLVSTAGPPSGFQVWYLPKGAGGSVSSAYLDAVGVLVADVQVQGSGRVSWTPPAALPAGDYALVPYEKEANTTVSRGQAAVIAMQGYVKDVYLIPGAVQTDQSDTITTTPVLHTAVYATNPDIVDHTVTLDWAVNDPLQPTLATTHQTATYLIPAGTKGQEIDAYIPRRALSLTNVAITLTDGQFSTTETFTEPGIISPQILPVVENSSAQALPLQTSYAISLCSAYRGQTAFQPGKVVVGGQTYTFDMSTANQTSELTKVRYLLPITTPVAMMVYESGGQVQQVSVPMESQSWAGFSIALVACILAILILAFMHHRRIRYQEKSMKPILTKCIFGALVIAGWFFVVALTPPSVHADFNACLTATPAMSQDAGRLLFRSDWTFSIPTATSNCAVSGTSPQNAAAPNELSGNPVKDFLCGYGLTYVPSSTVCYENWVLGVQDIYNVVNVQSGSYMAPTDHLKVGDSIRIQIDGLTEYYRHYSNAGDYLNMAAGSYTNVYPGYGTLPAGNNRRCPPGGSAPACNGAEPLSYQSQADGNYLCWGVTLAEVQACTRVGTGQNLSDAYTVTPDGNWSITKNADYYTLTALKAGTDRFSIFDSGHYVAEHTFLDLRFYSNPSFNAFMLSGGLVANISIAVDSSPTLDNPPTTPTLSCSPGTVTTFQNSNATFQSSDPDAGDSIRYEIDSDYNGSTFNPTTYLPVSGYSSDYTAKTLPFQWATTGTKTIAIKAEDSFHSLSGLATCTVTVTSTQTDTTPNLQIATDAGATQYTDQTTYYDFPQDKWGPTAAGITIPARYIGASAYQSCVITPYPKGNRGSQPNSPTFTTSWDSWPTFSSQPSYVAVPGGLHLVGASATVPSVGTTYTFNFQFGCGSSALTSQGSFYGSADIQTIVVRIATGSTAPSVQLTVAQQGSALQEYNQANNPYVFPTNLASSGADTATHLDLGWVANGVTSCTFTRNDTTGEQGTVSRSTWGWNGSQSTTSIFTGTDDTDMSFLASEAQPSYTAIYAVNCQSTQGPVSDVAFVQFKRSAYNAQNTVVQGTVFNDAGGTLGVQDAGEAGISNQQITVTINDYSGGPTTYTATTDGSGHYSLTFTPTLAQTQGLMTIQLTTALPNGWVYTYPLQGVYTNYLFSNGQSYTYNFGIRNGQFAYSTAYGKVYKDTNNNQVMDGNEQGIGNIQLQLQRVTTYSSAPTTVENLQTVTSASDGSYSVSTFVTSPPVGATNVFYQVHIVALPGPEWEYSSPINGIGIFDAVPNTQNQINFGLIPPVTIYGTVFYDANGSGLPAGQSPISGVNIQVFDTTHNTAASVYNLATGSSIPVTSVTTAADGSYSLALSPTTYGDTIEVRQSTRSGTYAYCTNPAEGSAPAPDTNKYCEYTPELISTAYDQKIPRSFGNSNSPTSSVNIVSGRVYIDNDGIPGFGSSDTPLANVQVGIYDQNNPTLAIALMSTDSTGAYFYAVSKNSAQYNALLGHKLIIKQTQPNGYVFVNPSGGEYQPADFNGNPFVGYDFTDAVDTGGGGTPPNNDTGIFCSGD